MKNWFNNISLGKLSGNICKLLGLGVIIGALFLFGEYLADYHMHAVVTVYCVLSLTFFVYIALRRVIKIAKQQIADEKRKKARHKNQKLLTYHEHHDDKDNHYFY